MTQQSLPSKLDSVLVPESVWKVHTRQPRSSDGVYNGQRASKQCMYVRRRHSHIARSTSGICFGVVRVNGPLGRWCNSNSSRSDLYGLERESKLQPRSRRARNETKGAERCGF